MEEVSDMNGRRYDAACAVFEGKIVVSGGHYNQGRIGQMLRTNEMYDHVADSWTNMPDLINSRYNHQLVAMKNKLFVVGGSSNIVEVTDSRCNMFTALKPPPIRIYGSKPFLTGNKIVVFKHKETKYLCYDIEKNSWSENESELILDLDKLICVQVPCLQ